MLEPDAAGGQAALVALTGSSLDFGESSSRAMGEASGAVFWGDVDGWSNPALLGLARGVRYDDEITEFDAGRPILLANDINGALRAG